MAFRITDLDKLKNKPRHCCVHHLQRKGLLGQPQNSFTAIQHQVKVLKEATWRLINEQDQILIKHS